MSPSLRRIVLACHVALIVLLAAAALAGGVTTVALFAAVAIVAPLLITLRALLQRRRGVERWLSVLLVPYAGALCVEVVARAGAPLFSAALLISVLELSVLLALIRSSRSSVARE